MHRAWGLGHGHLWEVGGLTCSLPSPSHSGQLLVPILCPPLSCVYKFVVCMSHKYAPKASAVPFLSIQVGKQLTLSNGVFEESLIRGLLAKAQRNQQGQSVPRLLTQGPVPPPGPQGQTEGELLDGTQRVGWRKPLTRATVSDTATHPSAPSPGLWGLPWPPPPALQAPDPEPTEEGPGKETQAGRRVARVWRDRQKRQPSASVLIASSVTEKNQ